MSTTPTEWVSPGQQVRHHRRLRGFSQQDLAARMDPDKYTQSWVSRIENDDLPLNRLTVIDAVAAALGISRYDITGEPAKARTPGDLDAIMSVQAVRAALLVPDEPTPARPTARLEDMADQTMRARMHCDYRSLGALLPPLLADARTLRGAAATRRTGLELTVKGAVTGALAFKPLGRTDIALLLAERAETAAAELGDPVYIAAAQFAMAQCVMAVGSANRQSLVIAGDAADQLAAAPRTARPSAAVAWRVMLLLHAGLSAALLHDDARSGDYLTAAADLVGAVDGDDWRMEATAANVALWRLSAAVSNGHPERADHLARAVRPAELRTPQRRSRLYMDLAFGRYLNEQYPESVAAFLEADRIAPDEIRRRVSVQNAVRDIVRHTTTWPAGRRAAIPAGLHDLAVNVGVHTADEHPI